MFKGLKFVILMLMFVSLNALSANNIYTGWFSNKAVSGYDTVAYFTEDKAVKGNPNYKYEYNGVEWYFSTDEHLSLFKAMPEKYMPQYGGFCAWAVAAKKQRAPGDPNYWTIINGKLYLNYDNAVKKKWLEDTSVFIKQANHHWPDLQ